MAITPIQQVRRFNRLVTQRIGVMQTTYLGQGRPFGEARLLFEIGHAGADVRDLRRRLNLDSGYVSRLLRTLETDGLIQVAKSPADGRVRLATLTKKGRTEVDTYDALSDQLAQSLIDPLDASQQKRLLDAMAEVERLLRASAIKVDVVAPDSPEARDCVKNYVDELMCRLDDSYDPAQAAPVEDDAFIPPHGFFVVARLDGRAVACGGVKRPEPQTAEIKRLWVDPSTRGLGLGRKVLNVLEDLARANGMTRVRLDSNLALPEAIALYRKAGYAEIPCFNDDPYAQIWFGKAL